MMIELTQITHDVLASSPALIREKISFATGMMPRLCWMTISTWEHSLVAITR